MDAVVWIDPYDAANEGDVLGAANVTSARLELLIVETIRGRENRSHALDAARRAGALIVPATEACLPDLEDAADLIELARREGWRALVLDIGADSASPSGTLLIEQQRELAAAAVGLDISFPVPPPLLLRRVALGEKFFRVAGFVDTRIYLDVFRGAGGSWSEPGFAILEWGAGSGRMTRHLRAAAPNARITSVDIDGEALEWLRSNVPVDEVVATGIMPPLPFPDDSFDLVIGNSIFTHIDEDVQDAWLAELARVTRPGGTVLVSVHGEAALRWHLEHPLAALAGAIGAAMPTLGFFFWRGEGWQSDFHDGYHTTFHEPWYIREHWSRWFDVIDVKIAVLRQRHDMVVLRPRRSPRGESNS